MHPTRRILFVCLGNICRSPMAEFILKDLVNRQGLEGKYHICSAATSREELGNPVHPGAQRRLRQAGISCKSKRARQITPADYDAFDLLIGMDGGNVREMRRVFPRDAQHKICRLLDFTDAPRDIADPWYTGDFEATWQDVSAGCRALLAALEQSALEGEQL